MYGDRDPRESHPDFDDDDDETKEKSIASVPSGTQSSELSDADLNPTNDQGLSVISDLEEKSKTKELCLEKSGYCIPYLGFKYGI